jgi:enoyl-CoA hydratase
LNRPRALNALSSPLFVELNRALTAYEEDPNIRAIVLTGSDKAFAAGADIKEMAPLTFAEAFTRNFIAPWSHLMTLRTPVIAAVSGHALGGGCELAMMCDILYCTKTANFGQPEIKLGTIPGAGGSQRLTKAIGKSKAMELILTGNNFSGAQAEAWGLAAKAFDGGNQEVLEGALKTAEKIASYSRVAVIAAKEVVNKSQELGIREGVEYERRIFQSLFGSQDQKIGMEAFAAKKKAEWSHS